MKGFSSFRMFHAWLANSMLIPTTIKSRRLVTAQNPNSEIRKWFFLLWQNLQWQKILSANVKLYFAISFVKVFVLSTHFVNVYYKRFFRGKSNNGKRFPCRKYNFYFFHKVFGSFAIIEKKSEPNGVQSPLFY